MTDAGWAAVLFDLDGTLADTVELILRSYRHTMRIHRGRELPDEQWLATMGTPLALQMRDFALDDDEAGRMLETYVTYQREVHDRMVAPYVGAVDVVHRLKARGVAVGIVTSKKAASATRTLARCGLADAFDTIVGADQVARPKPDPEPVRLALARLGLTGREREVVFVGDSPFDMASGREAGTRTAAALWGPFSRVTLEAERPDYWLERPLDVLELRTG